MVRRASGTAVRPGSDGGVESRLPALAGAAQDAADAFDADEQDTEAEPLLIICDVCGHKYPDYEIATIYVDGYDGDVCSDCLGLGPDVDRKIDTIRGK